MRSVLFLALLVTSSALPLSPTGENWAVLVAGSNTWMNYRHQADVYHAYQLMKKHGIDDSHIIVMHFDDIAHNKENPTPGIVVNKPNGTNVYVNVPKDYTGLEVTVENFLAVLRGEKSADGRVLESGPNDHVFINFVDHGAPGLVAFPLERMYADDFFNAIQDMHDAKMFSKLVIYMEACEAGSMFLDIMPDDMNVYVVTASNSTQSSYACYFDSERKTYLGDVFSIKWMEDDDKKPVIESQTLQKQFELVKKETATSNVSRYGDMRFTEAHLDEFMSGHPTNVSETHVYKTLKSAFSNPVAPPLPPKPCKHAVSSRDVSLAVLFHQMTLTANKEELETLRKSLNNEIMLREKIIAALDAAATESLKIAGFTNEAVLSDVMTQPGRPQNFDCYRPVVEHFSSNCFDLSQHDFAFGQLFKLSNLCERGISAETIKTALSSVCV